MNAVTLTSPQTLVDGTLADCATALVTSLQRLTDASRSAADLLVMTGNAGARGDTADDLMMAIAMHGHLVHQFNVKVRTKSGTSAFSTRAESASSVHKAVEAKYGDEPCGISVMRADADQASLAAAHRALAIDGPLDRALKNPALSVALHSYARKHRRRDAGPDLKRLAANDLD